jgi:hypothetical protein
VRAWSVVTSALNDTTTVQVHVIFLDISFMNHEQSLSWRSGSFRFVSGLKVCVEI